MYVIHKYVYEKKNLYILDGVPKGGRQQQGYAVDESTFSRRIFALNSHR